MTHSERKLQLLVARKINQRELARHGKQATKPHQRAINAIVAKILSAKTQARNEPHRASSLPLFEQMEGTP